LLIGSLLLVGCFLAALIWAGQLLATSGGGRGSATPGLDPTVAAGMAQQQATVLAGQQTAAAQYSSQATQIAGQSARFHATLTAVAGNGSPPILTSTPAAPPLSTPLPH
jgi:hypothetical protein